MLKTNKNTNMELSYSLLCLLCAIPILMAAYPPMVDVPQHAAQISAIKGMLGEGWRYEDMFELNIFTPYLLGYGLVLSLSYLVGIVLAIKIVIASAACFFAWSAGNFCKEMHVVPTWCWLFLILPFGFAYDWGFLNFIVAAPFGFIFLSHIQKNKYNVSYSSWIKIAIWLHFLFFSHILIAAFFCLIAALIIATPWDGLSNWIKRCLPLFTILPAALAWLINGIINSPSISDPVIWMIGLHRLTDFLPSLVSVPASLAGQLVGLFALSIPFLWGAKIKRSPLAWTPFLLYVAWMMFFPHYIAGNFYTYQRFGIFGLPLYFLCFEYKPGGTEKASNHRILEIGIATIVVGMLSWHSIRAVAFNDETRGYKEVIGRTEPEKRMLMLAFDPSSSVSNAPTLLHFGGWYQAESHGLTEFNFARFYVSPLQYKKDADSGITKGFEWYPGTFNWERDRGDLYDYILARTPEDASGWIAEKSTGKMHLIARSGAWQLYGKVESPQIFNEDLQGKMERAP